MGPVEARRVAEEVLSWGMQAKVIDARQRAILAQQFEDKIRQI